MSQDAAQVSHEFKSISEIITDKHFIEFVRKNLSETIKRRVDRPHPRAGFRYKRDWYDRMSSDGNLNLNFFLQNIESIWLKKSKLSSIERDVIRFVCDKSLQQTLSVYSKQNN